MRGQCTKVVRITEWVGMANNLQNKREDQLEKENSATYAKERSVSANTVVLWKLHLEHHTHSCLSIFKENGLTPRDLGGWLGDIEHNLRNRMRDLNCSKIRNKKLK